MRLHLILLLLSLVSLSTGKDVEEDVDVDVDEKDSAHSTARKSLSTKKSTSGGTKTTEWPLEGKKKTTTTRGGHDETTFSPSTFKGLAPRRTTPRDEEGGEEGGEGNCHDNNDKCPKYEYLCRREHYHSLMTVSCPHTCQRCSEYRRMGRDPKCLDVDRNCPLLVQHGLCSSTSQSLMTMRTHCAMSCGLCDQ